MSLQADLVARSVHLGGFLRDNGAAVTVSAPYSFNDLKLYKIHYHNVDLLKRIDVQWEPGLLKMEDVHMCMSVLRKGGSTCKFMGFCFRASHQRSGGCQGARVVDNGRLRGLMDEKKYAGLPIDRKELIDELAVAIRARERRSRAVVIQRDLAQLFGSSSSSETG